VSSARCRFAEIVICCIDHLGRRWKKGRKEGGRKDEKREMRLTRCARVDAGGIADLKKKSARGKGRKKRSL
jgi:hypothetical protein